ncbi:MAG: M1 family metallopeptidase [Thermoplasmata archaeon]|nr:M1 family metallopeptidase [Thermoplasmata archaeon]
MKVERYALSLDFPREAATFSGEVEIEVHDTGLEIVLNCQALGFRSVEVDGKECPFHEDPALEEVRIGPVGPGRHAVRIRYTGTVLEQGLVGLYRSVYGSSSIVTSMMYPTGARRVLPCVDHPAHKAVFELRVTCAPESVVIFNTPPAASELHDGSRTTRFAPTPPMSTYLLYFGIGPFSEVKAHAGPTEVIVALPAGRERSAEFALEHAQRAVSSFGEYYGLAYQLPKLHLVSVPAFWAGAMENWGAIAFRETQLLVDATTSARSRRLTRETISHEIAHQWFGNLVTMRWWNDFWLNEAFATLMQATLDSTLYPELELWSDFQMRFSRWGLDGDAFTVTHPIRVEVQEPSELGQIADEVTYGKGATVLRMIESYLGPAEFRAGVNRYLRKHAYGNTDAADLWAALEDGGNRPITKIMQAWLDRPGYPIVSVAVQGKRLRLTQHRFLYLTRPEEGHWPVPITLQIGKERQSVLLDAPAMELSIPEGAPVLLNPDRTGFFRAAYDADLTSRLDSIYGNLPEIDRWGLLSDASARVFAGELAPDALVKELGRASERPGFLLVDEAYQLYASAARLVAGDAQLSGAFREFFERAVESVGLEELPGEGELVGRLRGRALLGRIRTDEEFARQLARRFEEYTNLPVDLRLPVALAYGSTSDERAVAPLEARMNAAGSEAEASQMGAALASIPDPAALAHTLDLVLSPKIPPNRGTQMLGGAAANLAGGDLVWHWCVQHLAELDRILTGTPLLSILFVSLLPEVGFGRQEELRAYFSRTQFPEAALGVAKGLEWLEVLEQLRRSWGK